MDTKTIRLDLMHAGMHVFDSKPEQRRDVHKIFQRARHRGVHWITGTEAGQSDLREILEDAAKDYDYRYAVSRTNNDTWIAVQRDIVKRGWNPDYEKVIETGEGYGHHTQKGVFSVEFDPVDTMPIGHVTIIACHLLTRGADPGDPNTNLNRQLLREVGSLARKRGVGRAKVFYGGDQNIIDRVDDTFMGQPLTSAWDELKKWEGTGHGNIDVIASYDNDRTVSARYCRALDDRQLRLHTDHFLVEAGFDVLVRAA